MARTPPPPVKMTIRTERMRTELSGTIACALDQLLIASGDRAARESAIAQLQATHKRVTDWENERAKETANNG